MTVTHRVFYPTDLTLPSLPWLSRTIAAAKKLAKLPGFTHLKPFAVQALSVAYPPTYIVGRHFPGKTNKRSKGMITIMSANLWHDWPHHRRMKERLESFAHLVENTDADILLLQEVARTKKIRADEWLARQLGMAYFYVRANGNEKSIGFEEGVAILSRFPLNDPQTKLLGHKTNLFTRRLALSVCVETPFGGLRTFNAHLGLTRRQNANQMNHLYKWVEETSQENSALIGGDLNAHESTAQIAKTKRSWLDTFRFLHPHKDGSTHELKACGLGVLNRSRRDYLFLQPGDCCWQVLEAAHIKPHIYHSDHQVVLAKVKPVACH